MRWVILDDTAVNLDRVQYAYVDQAGRLNLQFGTNVAILLTHDAIPEFACAIGFPRAFDKAMRKDPPE